MSGAGSSFRVGTRRRLCDLAGGARDLVEGFVLLCNSVGSGVGAGVEVLRVVVLVVVLVASLLLLLSSESATDLNNVGDSLSGWEIVASTCADWGAGVTDE